MVFDGTSYIGTLALHKRKKFIERRRGCISRWVVLRDWNWRVDGRAYASYALFSHSLYTPEFCLALFVPTSIVSPLLWTYTRVVYKQSESIHPYDKISISHKIYNRSKNKTSRDYFNCNLLVWHLTYSIGRRPGFFFYFISLTQRNDCTSSSSMNA